MTQNPDDKKKAVVLVGHGAVAKDCPREWVTKLKALEAKRKVTREDPSTEELDLESRIRSWPRTPQNDPYKEGIESLAIRLKPLLNGEMLATAYNEFCAPTLEEAVEDLIAHGACRIKVVPSMMTPGGVHSEVDIPLILEKLRTQHPQVEIQYAWPFKLDLLANLMHEHLKQTR
jgi:sirohydrochlorin cobaltochelatase